MRRAGFGRAWGVLGVMALLPSGVWASSETPLRVVRLGGVLPGAAGEQRFEARVDALGLESAESIEVELPGGRIAAAARAFVERSEAGLVWSGRTAASEWIVLSTVGDRVAGTVFGADGAWELSPRGASGLVVRRLDSGDLPECAGASPAPAAAGIEPLTAPVRAGGRLPRIDLLVVYDQASRAAVGSKRDMVAVVQHYVDLTNVAFHNSGVAARVRLVETEEVALPPDVVGSNSRLLDWVSSSSSVEALRAVHGADLVGLVYEQTGTACGSAAMIYRPGGPTTRRAFFESNRACGANTFAHEVGHLMGADHDPANAVVAAGEYIYGRGHFYDDRYRTLMAYQAACDGTCPQQPFFSNPKVRFDGSSTGRRNERDNARILTEFAADVERFVGEVDAPSTCTLTPGDPDYCLECGPCVAGEGGCAADSECDSGLTCAPGAGSLFGLGAGVAACVAEPDCDLAPGDPEFCRLCGPCGFGGGDCDGDRECQSGLTCLDDVGAGFGLSPATDVCAFREGDYCPLEPGDPDYCAACGPCRPGEGNCKSSGECSLFATCFEDVGPTLGFPVGVDVCLLAAPESCPFSPGDPQFCSQCGVCELGEGDCDSDRECAPGLECAEGAGALFGLGESADACIEAVGGGKKLRPPKKLRAVVLSAKKVRLEWLDRTQGESGFHVELRRAGGEFERIASTAPDAAEHLVRKLRAGETYSFRMQAFDGGGTSKYSKIRTVTLP